MLPLAGSPNEEGEGLDGKELKHHHPSPLTFSQTGERGGNLIRHPSSSNLANWLLELSPNAWCHLSILLLVFKRGEPMAINLPFDQFDFFLVDRWKGWWDSCGHHASHRIVVTHLVCHWSNIDSCFRQRMWRRRHNCHSYSFTFFLFCFIQSWKINGEGEQATGIATNSDHHQPVHGGSNRLMDGGGHEMKKRAWRQNLVGRCPSKYFYEIFHPFLIN